VKYDHEQPTTILAYGVIFMGLAGAMVLVGWMLNKYVLVVLSLIGDLVVGVRILYLKSIVAIVIPGLFLCMIFLILFYSR
jgi:hypothetical protein